MLTESLLLASIGAVVGIALAVWAADWVDEATHNQTNPIPSWMHFTIDARVLVFVVGSPMVAAVVSGLLPALLASRANAAEALKEGGRGKTSRLINGVTKGLVVFQILVTSLLLVSSLLQVQSILRQQHIDYGYDTGSVISARMGLM